MWSAEILFTRFSEDRSILRSVDVVKGLADRQAGRAAVAGVCGTDDVRCRSAASKLVILDTQQDAAAAAAAAAASGEAQLAIPVAIDPGTPGDETARPDYHA